jgi:hypothetical protein
MLKKTFRDPEYADIVGRLDDGVLIALRDGVELTRVPAPIMCGGTGAITQTQINEFAQFFIYLRDKDKTV